MEVIRHQCVGDDRAALCRALPSADYGPPPALRRGKRPAGSSCRPRRRQAAALLLQAWAGGAACRVGRSPKVAIPHGACPWSHDEHPGGVVALLQTAGRPAASAPYSSAPADKVQRQSIAEVGHAQGYARRGQRQGHVVPAASWRSDTSSRPDCGQATGAREDDLRRGRIGHRTVDLSRRRVFSLS